MAERVSDRKSRTEIVLLEKFIIDEGRAAAVDSSSKSALLLYSCQGPGQGPAAHLVIKGGFDEDIVAYLAVSSPEIYSTLLACMREGSLFLDLEKGTARRADTRDKTPETVRLLEALCTIESFPNSFTGVKRKSKVVSVILGGGKGTRMQSKDLHKVCFPIAGRPAINRLLDQLESMGVDEHIIVVGEKGEQVVQEVTDLRDNVDFVYQINQDGTGNAAKQAAYLLKNEGFKGDVLVVYGDKVLEKEALVRLRSQFGKKKAGLALMTAEKKDWPDSGRIVTAGDGRPLDIVEKRDIQKLILSRRLLALKAEKPEIPPRVLLDEILKEVPSLTKARVMFPDLVKSLEKDALITFDKLNRLIPEEDTLYTAVDQKGKCRSLCGEELEKITPAINASVYLFSSEAFYSSVFAISSDNAQREEYLTDVVRLLAQDTSRQWRITAVPVKDRYEVMSFNNPEELLTIEEYYTGRESRKNASVRSTERIDVKYRARALRPAEQWLRIIEDFGAEVKAAFRETYGGHEDLIRERQGTYLDVLRKYIRVYGKNSPVILARSPGRVNLMGRHVDHRGGFTNYMTINREVLLAAGVRDDDVINIHNVDSKKFRPRSFSIGSELARIPWDEWLSIIDSETVLEMIHSSRGDWSNYFKASSLRLQEKYKYRLLYGFNGVLSGQIPLAAGLSSSSAVVVSAAEALTFINGFSLVPKDFVDLCGEGEWFVGTRGGSGDHAAMKFGEKGSIVHMGFYEVRIEDLIPFPEGYRVMILHSHQHASKSTGAMQMYNEKVATYEIAQEIVKLRFPELRERIAHLRDINPACLGLEPHEIYDILTAIPERITRKELMGILPADRKERMEKVFSSHEEPVGGYEARMVALFGLSEIARAKEFAVLLKEGRVEKAGELMNISHDGDRVTALNESGRRVKYTVRSSDKQMKSLRKRLAGGDLRASIQSQCGAYGCSTPLIDELVDISTGVEGVLGAQLSGAGLGGCIMALVKDEAVERFQDTITESFYNKNDLPPQILNCTPIAGSGVFYL